MGRIRLKHNFPTPADAMRELVKFGYWPLGGHNPLNAELWAKSKDNRVMAVTKIRRHYEICNVEHLL